MHIFIHIFAQELKQVSFTGSFDTNNLLLVMPNKQARQRCTAEPAFPVGRPKKLGSISAMYGSL